MNMVVRHALRPRGPLHAGQLLRQLLRIDWIDEGQVDSLSGRWFLGCSDDEPEHFGLCVIEDLAQLVRSDQHATMLWHSKCLVAHAHSTCAFNHKIKLLSAYVFVECIGALWRKAPKPCAKQLALSPLEEIGVWNPHDV